MSFSSAQIIVPSTITALRIGVDWSTIKVYSGETYKESPSLGATSPPHESAPVHLTPYKKKISFYTAALYPVIRTLMLPTLASVIDPSPLPEVHTI